MKRTILFLFLILVNFSFAQKKELRKAQKLYDAGDIAAAQQVLTEFQSLLENSDEKTKPNYNFLKGKIARVNKEFQIAYDILMPLKEVAALQTNVSQELNLLAADIVNSAIDDNAKNDFESSAKKLYLAYQIDKEANEDYLYFAASSAVNASLYETALEYYMALRDLNYTGIETKYFVSEFKTENEIEVTESVYGIYK